MSQVGGQENTGNVKAGIAGVAILVAPLITAVSGLALTGTIGRVQRDAPDLLSIAIGFVIVAGTLWVVASTFTAPKAGENHSKRDLALRWVALGFAALGFLFAILAAISTANNEPRPRITPTLSDDRSELTLEIETSSLSTERRLAVRVDLLDEHGPVGQVYEAYVGPDEDGNVDYTVTLPLPASGYTRIGAMAYTEEEPICDRFVRAVDDSKPGTGCVIISLPNPPPKP